MKEYLQQYFANTLRLRRIMIGRFQAVNDTIGLSPAQGELVMMLLKAGKPQTTTAIAASMRTSAAAVSQQLDMLEKMGCISRLPDTSDRRSIKIAVNDNDPRVLRLRAYLADIAKEMTDGLSQAEIDQLLSIQDKLIHIFSNSKEQHETNRPA